MLKAKTALLIFCFFSSFLIQAQSEWELKSDEDGIEIYTRHLPNKKFLEFKASTTVEGSMHGIMSLIKDVNNMNDWMQNFRVNELLETNNFWHQVSYHEVHIPVLQNRDLVLELKLAKNDQDNSLRIDMQSLPEFIPEKRKRTRIQELYGYWLCKSLGNGKIRVEYSMYVDPGKSIPSWLYNMRIKKDPYTTLNSIRNLVKEEKMRQAYFSELEPISAERQN